MGLKYCVTHLICTTVMGQKLQLVCEFCRQKWLQCNFFFFFVESHVSFLLLFSGQYCAFGKKKKIHLYVNRTWRLQISKLLQRQRECM